MPQFDETACRNLPAIWPGMSELRNVIERACFYFQTKPWIPKGAEHLQQPNEEQDALWAATADLDPPNDMAETHADMPLPHPSHYRDWFAI